MLQAVLANLLSLRELHSGNKTRKTPRPEITISENKSKLFLERILKEERILDKIMRGGRFSGGLLCFILWSVFSNQRVTLCATIMTQRISIRFDFIRFFSYSVISNLRIIFCFLFAKHFI